MIYSEIIAALLLVSDWRSRRVRQLVRWAHARGMVVPRRQPREVYVAFDINAIPIRSFFSLFRFEKADLVRLHAGLRMPTHFRLQNRSFVTSMHGLCIILRRLAYTARHTDLEPLLQWDVTTMSRAFTMVAAWLWKKVHAKLHWDENRLKPELLQHFAECVQHTAAAQFGARTGVPGWYGSWHGAAQATSTSALEWVQEEARHQVPSCHGCRWPVRACEWAVWNTNGMTRACCDRVD